MADQLEIGEMEEWPTRGDQQRIDDKKIRYHARRILADERSLEPYELSRRFADSGILFMVLNEERFGVHPDHWDWAMKNDKSLSYSRLASVTLRDGSRCKQARTQRADNYRQSDNRDGIPIKVKHRQDLSYDMDLPELGSEIDRVADGEAVTNESMFSEKLAEDGVAFICYDSKKYSLPTADVRLMVKSDWVETTLR